MPAKVHHGMLGSVSLGNREVPTAAAPAGVAAQLRRLAARVGRGRTLPRRLPEELGGCWFPASLEGGAKFLRLDPHRFDPVLTRFAQSMVRTGSIVWDVGANVGLFSYAAAGLAGPTGSVIAIEPDVWLAANLARARRWNPLAAEVVVIPVAIADSVHLAEFTVAANTRAASYLTSAGGSPVAGGARERRIVPTLTLDFLAKTFPPPDILKIDVEGAEVLVLNGGDSVLQSKPVILIETGERTATEVHRTLSQNGYRYVDAATGKQVTWPVFNTIAIPDG